MGFWRDHHTGTPAAAAAPEVRAETITIGTVPTYTGELPDWMWDQMTAGLYGHAIPRRVAKTVPAVRRGLLVITGAIASMPLVRRRGPEVLPAGPLLTQPEADRAYVNTLISTVEDLVCGQYAWWLVVAREFTGYPSRVVRLEPEYVQVETEVGTDEVIRTFATYRGTRVRSEDLIRFEGPDEGLLVYGAETICTALSLEASARRYSEPEIPTGVLSTESDYVLQDDEVDALLDGWREARRKRQTAYVGNAKYTPVFSTPEQMQMVQSREENALQIARHLGLPPRYVNTASGDSQTYSNVTSERRELRELSLAPYMAAIEQRLSMPDRNGSPRGQTIRFDIDAWERPTVIERADIYTKTVPLGITTVQEARDNERGTAAPTAAAPEVTQ